MRSRDLYRPIEGQYSGHLEVDVSGGSLQDGLISQGQRVAGVNAVIVTLTIHTNLKKTEKNKKKLDL